MKVFNILGIQGNLKDLFDSEDEDLSFIAMDKSIVTLRELYPGVSIAFFMEI